MESSLLESKSSENDSTKNVPTSSSTNLFTESLELPDDTFRMSLDNFSLIGENVTIGERVMSVDSNAAPKCETPVLCLPTPCVETPETPRTPPTTKSPPIVETPKHIEDKTPESRKPPTLLKLTLKKDDNDIFIRPSPIADVMSPAKMLQFEIDIATSSTPTMKRAAVDFEFFNKNNFEEYFDDIPKDKIMIQSEEVKDDKTYEETPVIVKASTVRHEIGYGEYIYVCLKHYSWS